MKRLLLHIIFWVLYVFQDSVLVFTWIGPSLRKMPDLQLASISFAAALIMLIPKILITYFILLYSIKRIGDGTSSIVICVTEIIIVFIISIAIYRVLSKYYVNPVIYSNALKSGALIDVRRILMALMDIGFVTGLAVTFKFIRLQLKNKEKEKNLVKEKLGAELKFLRNQTNPHFLMNTLNNIYGLARKKSDETAEVVMKLSELLRFMLYESNERFISLCDEVKMLEDYLELERMRYNDRLTVTFTKETDNDDYLITPLLLLPFVENAFKHGLSETRFESFIYIDLKAKEGQLNFVIENSKESAEGNIAPDSIGLNNVKRQLELAYEGYKMETKSDDLSYRVSLEINLNNHAVL